MRILLLRNRFCLLVLASALFLSGCGGGGNNDDGFYDGGDYTYDGGYLPPPQPNPPQPYPTPGAPSGILLAYYDSYDAYADTLLSVGSLDGVLVNDSYPIGETYIDFPLSSVQGGEVDGYYDGGFDYRPQPGFVGEDSFVYTLSDDSGRTSTARVYLNVYP